MENMKLSVILQHINNLNISIMRKFLFLMLSAFIITACNNDDDKTLTKEKIPLSTDSLTYMYHGGFRYVGIDEEDWYIQKVVTDDATFKFTSEERKAQMRGEKTVKTCDWLTIETHANRVVIYAAANSGFENIRKFQIEFQSKNRIATLNGVQEGEMMDGLTHVDPVEPSSRAVKFDCNGGATTITTKTKWTRIIGVFVDGKHYPIEYDKVLDGQYDWLTIRHEENRIELEAEENPTSEPRIFDLALSHLNYFPNIPGIQQAAGEIPATDIIGFTPNKIQFPLEGGTVEVMANTDGWELDSPLWMKWLTIEQEGNRLKLTCAPNFDYNVRNFALRFKKGNYYEYLEGGQQSKSK